MIAGILRRVTRDAANLVRTSSAPSTTPHRSVPAEDPILQQTVGLLSSQAFAAEAVVLSAAEALSDAYAAHGTAAESDLSLRAALRAAKAKSSSTNSPCGRPVTCSTSAAVPPRGAALHLDRHWRNIRTLAAHNPKHYKARAIGAT